MGRVYGICFLFRKSYFLTEFDTELKSGMMYSTGPHSHLPVAMPSFRPGVHWKPHPTSHPEDTAKKDCPKEHTCSLEATKPTFGSRMFGVLLLGEPLTRNHRPWPSPIVNICMSYLTTRGPGKERGTNKLPATGIIWERSK